MSDVRSKEIRNFLSFYESETTASCDTTESYIRNHIKIELLFMLRICVSEKFRTIWFDLIYLFYRLIKSAFESTKLKEYRNMYEVINMKFKYSYMDDFI